MKAKRPSEPMLFLLGAPRLERDGKTVEIDTRKALALVAYLVLARTSHSRDALATLLYPDYDQTHARAALRRTLFALQAALGEGQVDADRESIALHPAARLIVDVDEFHKRIEECHTHGHAPNEVCARCITPLAEAVALYRDDFMAGFTLRDSPPFDEWQFFQTETLRRDLAQVLEKLVRHHTAQREYDLAIVYARRWLALDPLHEPAHRQLMQLYGWAGQHAAAVRQYQECVRVLQKELGVAPLEETTRLFQAIKENRGEEPKSPIGSPPAPLPARTVLPPLVGRAGEWDTLLHTYHSIRTDGHLIVLEGEMGIGKTRLAETFLEHARSQGAATLTARGYEGSANLAYGPFVEALRAASAMPEMSKRVAGVPTHFVAEAARLLPELELPDKVRTLMPLDSPGAQIRFFEGVAEVVFTICKGTVPGVLFIDDVQWIDTASFDLLTYMVHHLRGRPLCLLWTLRTDAVSPHLALRQLIAESHRAGLATTITLSRLSAQDVEQLAMSIAGAPSEIAERLYRETEGVPFFVVEYLAAIEKDSANWVLPDSARDVLRSRLVGLSETGWQMLSAAAVIGRSFDFDTLRDASGRSEDETIVALEELSARGLVREASGGTNDFVHEQLRAVTYEETSQARRRLLHRRVAQALVTRTRLDREVGARASQVAFHFQRAGQAQDAAEYFKLAGEHARALYANIEALAHFRAALDLHHPASAALHEAIGDLQTLKGDYQAALESYETAALLQPDAPTLQHKHGALHHRRGEWDQAVEHYKAALGAFNEDAASERARVYADWSLTAHQQGQYEEAETLARRALELAETAADLCALAQARNILGILAQSRGDWDGALKHLNQSAALGETLQDPAVRAAALNNLALVYRDRGELDRAIQLTETALSLAVSQGDRHREAALENNLADLLHAAGRTEVAMVHLKQAVAIFAEIGLEAGALRPEIWKLVQW